MQTELTNRQTQLLKAIIDEYIDTAEPVGSLAIEQKYNLGVSPATIRNEMVELTNKEFLRQPHTSAGRVPTPHAMKFYINQLMEEKKLSVTDEVNAKESVWDSRENVDQLLREATRSLAEQSNYLAVATTNDGGLWAYGHGHIFDSPEFANQQVCRNLFTLLDEHRRVQELFFERLTGLSPIEVLFGEELGWEFFEPVGVVATRFQIGGRQGALGIIGPYRLDYASVIPQVRYFGTLIQELSNHA